MVLALYPITEEGEGLCDVCLIDLEGHALVVRDKEGNPVARCCSVSCCQQAEANDIWDKVIDAIMEDLK